MTDPLETKIVSLQFALFFRDIVDRPDVEFNDINMNMMNIFDAIPSIIPIPRELPAEVPIVTQRSDSNNYICNIARSRIDLHYQRINNDSSNIKILNDFNSKILGLISYVLKKRPVVRFGMICRYFHSTQTPIQDIRSKYFRSTIGNVEELSLRYNNKSKFFEWEMNDIVEISAATQLTDIGNTSGILVQRDINNNPISDRIISESDLHEISKYYSKNLSEKNIKGLLK